MSQEKRASLVVLLEGVMKEQNLPIYLRQGDEVREVRLNEVEDLIRDIDLDIHILINSPGGQALVPVHLGRWSELVADRGGNTYTYAAEEASSAGFESWKLGGDRSVLRRTFLLSHAAYTDTSPAELEDESDGGEEMSDEEIIRLLQEDDGMSEEGGDQLAASIARMAGLFEEEGGVTAFLDQRREERDLRHLRVQRETWAAFFEGANDPQWSAAVIGRIKDPTNVEAGVAFTGDELAVVGLANHSFDNGEEMRDLFVVRTGWTVARGLDPVADFWHRLTTRESNRAFKLAYGEGLKIGGEEGI